MKVLIDISEEEIKSVKKWLQNNKNSSISQFISISIQNQIALESEVFDIPSLESIVQSQVMSPKVTPKEKMKKLKIQDLNRVKTVNGMKVNDDFPFWGTQNKYLCLKQITIDLVKLVNEIGTPWVRYDIAMNSLLQSAIETRKLLESIDKHLHRPRGERLSTGFPKNDSKSLTRYEKQFIGGIDGNDNLYGMSVIIGFLAIRKKESSNRVEFGITKDGFNFSTLDSPIFNKNSSDILPSTPPFNDEEVQFIISILKKRKISEINIMEFTLNYIADGKNHPDEGCLPSKEYLDLTYPTIARDKKEGSFSTLEADTIRAGVISRMNELGFINIIKKGIKSEYHVTDFGNKFIQGLRGK